MRNIGKTLIAEDSNDTSVYILRKTNQTYVFDFISADMLLNNNFSNPIVPNKTNIPSEWLDVIEPYLQEVIDGKTDVKCKHVYLGRTYIHHLSLFEGRILGKLVDITEDCKLTPETESGFSYDGLTGLPNRMKLSMDLRTRIEKANQDPERYTFTLLVVDMDNIKYTNESKGHYVGDELIRSVAQKLIKIIGDTESIYRIGGDEFVVLIDTGADSSSGKSIAKKIVKAAQQPVRVAEQFITSTLSVGVSIYPFDGDDSDTLLRNAQLAMQRVKSQGKNGYYFFQASLAQERLRRLEIEEQLKYALFNNEMEVYYQPQVDIHTNQVMGTEALLRWLHPVHGYISPAEFIPIAEETGLIINIGEWVLKTSCAQQVEWVNRGYVPLRMSVNLSATQFTQKNLVQTVLNVVKDTGMDPKYLNLEITESTSMIDIDFTIRTLKKFRAVGIMISIDDFGTGYSSLNYLTRFPITCLKIDKSFVNQISTKSGETVAKSIIILAKGLELSVIAEGVETVNQLDILKLLDCEEMQGYLFSPAVIASDFEKYLTKQK